MGLLKKESLGVNRRKYGEDSQVVSQHNGTGKLLKIFLGKLSLNDLTWSWSVHYMMRLSISSEMTTWGLALISQSHKN